jgi:hypothetical protein
MAVRKPVVMVNGMLQRLPDGDTISGAQASPTFTATNANGGAVTMGQPVYVSAAGAVDLAQANASGTAKVAGLVGAASVAAGAAGAMQYGGVVTLADWTQVIGAATLTAGAAYFLSAATAGQLTATAPDSTGQYVTRVGKALSTTELLIEIAEPIGA